MEAQVNIAIPQRVYQQADQIAQLQGINVIKMIVEYLERSLAASDDLEDEIVDQNSTVEAAVQPDISQAVKLGPPNLKEEQIAYKQMHAELLENYAGEYVAIYGQKLIDHDVDKIALFDRIDERYPDSFVLMRPVEQKPEREFYFRSTRFLERI